MSVDSNLILSLGKLLLFAIGIVTAGFTILGSVAFWRTRSGGARSFTLLLQRGNALRLLTVITIVIAVALLALIGILDGSAAAAILSSIVGYVLGGLERDKEESKQANRGGENAEP